MKISITSERPWIVEADVLAAPISADAGWPADPSTDMGPRFAPAIAALRDLGEPVDDNHVATLVSVDGSGAPWVLAVGIDQGGSVDARDAVRLGATIVRRLAGRRVSRLAVWLPDRLCGEGIDRGSLVELVVRGIVEGTYDPGLIYRDKVHDPPLALDELILIVDALDDTVGQRAERGRIIGEGTNDARTLSQRSADDLTPARFAEEAEARGKEFGWRVEILGPDEAAALGMGMFVALGRGSDRPPRMILVRTAPDRALDAQGRLVAFVGKGVTFDAGGINLKTDMPTMGDERIDKAGGATVLAALTTLSRLAPDVPVLGVIAAIENMPGPHSVIPGDVVRALNGLTVEIAHTDAEGRAILGDALTHAERNGATHLVGLGTLSGLSDGILGPEVQGGYGEPDAWWDELSAAGAAQGETHFRMPLIDAYLPNMASWYADISNAPRGYGALIQAGLFMRQFRTLPWVFIDLSWIIWERSDTPWTAVGANGRSHATLVELMSPRVHLG